MKTQFSLVDCSNIFDVLAAATKEGPDHPFCSRGSHVVTRKQLLDRATALATVLTASGLALGDRVAVMLENSTDCIALVFAMAKAGLTWVPINTRLRGDGLGYILAHSEPRCVIVEEALRPFLAPVLPTRLRDATVYRSNGDPLLGDGAVSIDGEPLHAVDEPERLLCISYTSGTTGRPKGVMISHRMLAAASQAVMRLADVRDGDTMIVWEPFYHIGGSQLLLLPLYRRVTLALTEKFSSSTFLSAMRDAGATHMHYLGGVLSLLLKQPARPDDRHHSARIAWGGGAPKEIWRRFEDRFGISIRECYGMTETSSIATCNFDGHVGSIGTPLSWFDAWIAAPNGGEAAPGEHGEIVVRERVPGLLMDGYFKDPEATRRALRDGVLHTGDLGSRDLKGRFYFHGRMSDSVRTKGENVSAFEIEHIVSQHPDVEECAMIGVAGEFGEQDIKLFIKLKPDRLQQAPAVAEWCKERMASFQIPRYFAYVDTFEKTPSERIKKHLLSQATGDSWDRIKGSFAGGERQCKG